jgi:hypothetical protein
MERVLKIPKFLAHLKTYSGYPVPFTQLWASDKPDFRAVDMEHCARCLRDKLCSLSRPMSHRGYPFIPRAPRFCPRGNPRAVYPYIKDERSLDFR